MTKLWIIVAILVLNWGCQPGASSLKTRSVSPGPPSLSLSPTNYNFGDVYVASIPVTASFTITNSGLGPASGCSAPVIGGTNAADFSVVVDNCSTSDLAVGNCTIGVRAVPSTTGVRTATLYRSCVNGGTVSTTANAIQVTGVVASVALDVSTRNFGNVSVGVASDTQTFVITNSGGHAATGCSAPTLGGTNAADFALSADTCSTNSLSAGGSCSFVVTSTPLAAGSRAATVSRTCIIGGTVSSTVDGLSITGKTSQLSYLERKIDGFSTVTGLAGVRALTVSSDGKHLYAAGKTDDAIEVFTRNLSNGALTQISSVSEPATSGLDGVMGVAVSPDGRHLYAAADVSDAVTSFSRNLSTGALTFVASYPNGVSGVSGLNGAADLVVSPDGRAVYVVSNIDNSLAAFSRTASTGALTFVAAYTDGAGSVDGLNGALAVAISSDGRHVYTVGNGEDAVSTFSRTISTGALSFVQVHKDNVSSVDGLQGARDVAVSPDGRNVYVAGFTEDKLAVFSRNALTGALTYVESHTDNAAGVNGLDGISAIRISPDGRFVFATGSVDKAIAIFSRNLSSGVLTFKEVVLDDNAIIDGMDGVEDLFITHDGLNLYAAGTTDDSVAVFSNALLRIGEPTYASYAADGVGSVSGLDGAQQLTLSPDGRNIYALGNTDDALEVFTRDPATGLITWLEKHTDGTAGVDGLNGAASVAVSPDGLNVYVVGDADDALAVFRRNASTGALTYSTVITNGSIGGTGLTDPRHVIVSADGKNVYVAAYGGDCITVFNRNADTGALTYSTVLLDGAGGINGLDGASFVTIAPSGNFLIGVGEIDSGLTVLTRDTDTGALAWLENHLDGVGGVDGLGGASSVALSYDNDSVYVSGYSDDALAVFTRNVLTGALTYSTAFSDGVAGVNGLDGAFQLLISRDNSRIYVTGENDHALAVFSRSVTTGALTYVEAHVHGSQGVGNFQAPRGIAISDDGGHLYCPANTSDAIAIFDID